MKDAIEILGPSPAPLEKLKGEYRWQMLIKGRDGAKLVDFSKRLHENFRESFGRNKEFTYKLDLDPQNFM